MQRTGSPVTYNELTKFLNGPGNGLDDIYCVKFNLDWQAKKYN